MFVWSRISEDNDAHFGLLIAGVVFAAVAAFFGCNQKKQNLFFHKQASKNRFLNASEKRKRQSRSKRLSTLSMNLLLILPHNT